MLPVPCGLANARNLRNLSKNLTSNFEWSRTHCAWFAQLFIDLIQFGKIRTSRNLKYSSIAYWNLKMIVHVKTQQFAKETKHRIAKVPGVACLEGNVVNCAGLHRFTLIDACVKRFGEGFRASNMRNVFCWDEIFKVGDVEKNWSTVNTCKYQKWFWKRYFFFF